VRQEHSGENNESRMPFVHTLLGQGRLEQFILDSIHENSSIKVERGVVAEALNFNELDQEDHAAYPITVQLRTLNPKNPVNGEAKAQNGPIKLENGVVNRQLSDESNGVPPEIQREEKVEIVKARYLLACDGARSWTRTQMGLAMEGSSTEYVWYVTRASKFDRLELTRP
jgi:phenol 2-monooxygenase